MRQKFTVKWMANYKPKGMQQGSEDKMVSPFYFETNIFNGDIVKFEKQMVKKGVYVIKVTKTDDKDYNAVIYQIPLKTTEKMTQFYGKNEFDGIVFETTEDDYPYVLVVNQPAYIRLYEKATKKSRYFKYSMEEVVEVEKAPFATFGLKKWTSINSVESLKKIVKPVEL